MRNLEILADFDAQAVNGGRGRSKNSLKPVKPVGPTTSWGHCAPPKPPIEPCHTHHGMGNTYAPTTQTNTANVTANGYYSGAYVGILQGNLAVGA